MVNKLSAARRALQVVMIGLSGSQVFATPLASAADLSMEKAPNSPAPIEWSLETIISERQNERNASLLSTHLYQREPNLRYLASLNNQLLAVQAISLLLSDYSRALGALSNYNSALDKCTNSTGARPSIEKVLSCRKKAEQLSTSVEEYYNFVDAVGTVKAASKSEFFARATSRLISNLSRLVDTAAAKDQALANQTR